ncbi:MAG: hypothetical protein WD990_10050 [Acidimicrobiia bacterium]
MTATDPRIARRTPAGRVMEAGSRVVRTLDFREPSWVRPLPRVKIQIGRWVPGWAVRVCAASIAVGCIAMVATSRPEWVLALVLVGLMLLRPSGASPALFALWLGLQVATAPDLSYGFDASGLVFGLHLLAVLFATAANLHPLARIELRVFAAPLRRVVVIQAVVQPITWATMSLAAGDVTVRWLPLVAAVGVAVSSWVLVRRIARQG